jgi:hypothetical protein
MAQDEGDLSLHDMQGHYREYLKVKRAEGNAREAHLFALAMKHRGVTFGLPVQEVVLALEGALPAYWPQP